MAIWWKTLLTLLSVILLTSGLRGADPVDGVSGDDLLNQFFSRETAKVSEHCLAEIKTLEDWKSRRQSYHDQLSEMLGLRPWPERTPLRTVVTGTHEREGVIVENLHFQSMPGLYVTANLYRPTKQDHPLPAVLYVCGHGGVKKDGVSYGNKTHYQHHGAWFARNGFVCLIIDTIQLGELEGIHHGTYRYGMWWWHNRGYTSAGAEAWNGIRALDYLQSRLEVDGERLGVTGRSGGGAYSWWVAALDERVKAAVPVAGITSMQNHIVDGCIEGHCDCMYMVNTFTWDFPLLAAMVAPRALLISNTDKDRIFPLDGVVDVYAKTRRIYELHGALDHIGLNIAEGPHKDTQELRVNAFHWMNRFLKNDDPLIETVATKLFSPEELKVFDKLPDDERVTTIQESFAPQADSALPETQESLDFLQTDLLKELKRTSFRNRPVASEDWTANIAGIGSWKNDDSRLSILSVPTDEVYSLPLYLLEPHRMTAPVSLRVIVCDEQRWHQISGDLAAGFPQSKHFRGSPSSSWAESAIRRQLLSQPNEVLVFCLPRGVGATAWTGDERKQTQIKRRFALLGHTLDSLRIHDVLQCVKALQHHPEIVFEAIHLEGRDQAADWALFATILGANVASLHLEEIDCHFDEGPELLQVSQFLTKPASLLLAANRVNHLKLTPGKSGDAHCWKELSNVVKKLQWPAGKLEIK